MGAAGGGHRAALSDGQTRASAAGALSEVEGVGIERMLRLYFLAQWYALADEALEDALYDSQALRSFAGIDLGSEAVPDATTLLGFRHLFERHDLGRRIFEEVGALLGEKKLLMREGTLIDASIIAAPSSTKNRRRERDPAMHQTKKGNQ